MVRRYSIKRPPPKWFNLDRYNLLLELDSHQLCVEASRRGLLLASDSMKNFNKVIERLEKGEVTFFSKESARRKGSKIGGNQLPFLSCSRMPTFRSVHESYVIYNKVFSEHVGSTIEYEITAFHNSELSSIYLDAPNSFFTLDKTTNIQLNIDFDSTDEEILSDIKRVREWAKIPESSSEKRGSFGPSIIDRIISYKVIPMLDLMIWAKSRDFEYTHPELLEILHPLDASVSSEITSLSALKRTHITYLKRFCDPHYLEWIESWLDSKDRDTGKMNADIIVKDITSK
ncbi:MAG: DUF6387 family protein [Oceanisphaera sp.]|uniref:DUF6387 family protein n=1 Tax=Oceanisphaera sp. TaxID=1929979 RepID=UPI003C73C753